MNKKTDKEIPDLEIDVRETFDIDIDLKVMAFKAVSYTHLRAHET